MNAILESDRESLPKLPRGPEVTGDESAPRPDDFDGEMDPSQDLIIPVTEETANSFSDRQWFYKQLQNGAFDQEQGKYIAIFRERILGTGTDPNMLRDAMASATSIPGSRIVVMQVMPRLFTN